MSFKITLREQRARAVLRAWRVEAPTAQDWEEALKMADNAINAEKPKSKDYIGLYGYAKQDITPYKPLLQVGCVSSTKKDDLLEWLLAQPNPYRK